MIVLGIPVLEQHELTHECLQSMSDTVQDTSQLHVVLIDNGSDTPYTLKEFNVPFTLSIIRNEVNQGFYLPLKTLLETYGNADFIGLMHNDVYFYDKGWEKRLQQVFSYDDKLALVGLVGGTVIDIHGGRGMGTVGNFKGERGSKVGIAFINEVTPSLVLDSLFMLFRTKFIPELEIDEEITPCHFYDKIWSLKMIEKGYHVATIGIQIDHMGGQTSCSPKYQEDAIRWCKEHGHPLLEQDGRVNGDLTLYKVAENRYLGYYRDQKHMIPCHIDRQYNLRWL